MAELFEEFMAKEKYSLCAMSKCCLLVNIRSNLKDAESVSMNASEAFSKQRLDVKADGVGVRHYQSDWPLHHR